MILHKTKNKNPNNPIFNKQMLFLFDMYSWQGGRENARKRYRINTQPSGIYG
jgi:hypothetical protein